MKPEGLAGAFAGADNFEPNWGPDEVTAQGVRAFDSSVEFADAPERLSALSSSFLSSSS